MFQKVAPCLPHDITSLPLLLHLSGHILATAERFLLVDPRPLRPEDHLLLEDGSAVICLVPDLFSASTLTADVERLEIRLFSTLSDTDQERVSKAFREQGEAA